MTGERYDEFVDRLLQLKSGELMIGRNLPEKDAVNMPGPTFLGLVREIFETLYPIYRMAV